MSIFAGRRRNSINFDDTILPLTKGDAYHPIGEYHGGEASEPGIYSKSPV
jgi:hypothetical protein